MPSKDTREFDVVEKVRVWVRDLRLGMFVCELDRPWLETPFLFQGFELKTAADIEEVKKHCKYVYVDLLRTRIEQVSIDAPPPGSFTAVGADPALAARAESVDATSPGPFGGGKTTSFEQEAKTAETVKTQVSSLVKSFMDDIRFGTSVDIQMAKEAVSGCVSSVMRNPDALMFMTQMREKSELISQHAMNSCVYSIIMGGLIGLEGDQLVNLGTCGLLHDLGKVSIPEAILNKPGPLTDEETAIVRQHAKLGRDILMSGRKIFTGAVDVAYAHHEHLDGSGYPRGLNGNQLNLNCKIVAVVEKYDALLSPRPHRPPYNHLDGLNLLNRMAKQNHLDPEVVNRFVAYLGIYPPGSIVELSTREKAIVLETNPGQRLRPRILVVRDPEENPLGRFVDLALKRMDEQNQPLTIKAVHPTGAFGINLLDYRGAMKTLG